MIKRTIYAAFAIGVIACGASAITGTGGKVTVAWRVQDQRVDLTNSSAKPIRYAVIGRTWFHNALALWCFGTDGCGAPLAVNATARVAYPDISGGEPPEKEALIIWWTPTGSGFAPFDTVIVRIR